MENKQMNSFRQFGERIKDVQDRIRKERSLVQIARERLLCSFNFPGTQRFIIPRLTFVFSTGLAVAIVLAFVIFTPGPLTMVVGQNNRPAEKDEWLAATQYESLRIRFSDGSIVKLEKGSGARVKRLDSQGASVLLERGVAVVYVQKKDNANWDLNAGPFVVKVTGTQFYLSWDPVSEQFGLTLKKGSVTVSGPMLKEGRKVSQGEIIQVWLKEQRVEINRINEQKIAETLKPKIIKQPKVTESKKQLDPPTIQERQFEKISDFKTVDTVKGQVAKDSKPNMKSTWLELAAHANYKEALTSAKGIGFEHLIKRAPPDDMLTLGDTARLAGDSKLARKAYFALRKRFPETKESARSAFTLGRITFDEQNYLKAAKWFEIYLLESRSDMLKREAFGRILEARHRSGDILSAKNAAKQYLELYADGPHADLARSVQHDCDNK